MMNWGGNIFILPVKILNVLAFYSKPYIKGAIHSRQNIGRTLKDY